MFFLNLNAHGNFEFCMILTKFMILLDNLGTLIPTCINNPGDIDVRETVCKLVHIDNTVDTVPAEVVVHLSLDSLVLGPK